MSSHIAAAVNQLVNNTRRDSLEQYLTCDTDQSVFTHSDERIARFVKIVSVHICRESPLSFGKTLTFEIDLQGMDYLSQLYLRFRLPALELVEGSTFTTWTQSIAFALIDTVELRFGNTVVVRQPGNFLEVVDYLTHSAGNAPAHSAAVGRTDSTLAVTQNSAVRERELYVRLPFFFSKSLSAALPLFAMNPYNVTVVLKLRPFTDLIIYDGPDDTISKVKPGALVAELISESFIVTDRERDDSFTFAEDGTKLLSPPLTYLMDEWQYSEYEIAPDTATYTAQLKSFSGHVKEFIFYVIETESEEQNDYFMFGERQNNGLELIETVALSLDGKLRIGPLRESYFRLVTPQKYHSYAGNRNIYVLPFNEMPESNRPLGTLDVSAFDAVSLSLTFRPSNPRCRLHVLALSLNRLVISHTGVQVQYVT